MTPIEFEVPIRTVTGLNAREHWRARARRVEKERLAVARYWQTIAWSWRRELELLVKAGDYFVVTLTRIGPRKCDSDNLQGALKAVRDQVAEELGLDDGDERLEWRYEQEQRGRGVLGVRVRIETREERNQ
jgi:hypothetical protein